MVRCSTSPSGLDLPLNSQKLTETRLPRRTLASQDKKSFIDAVKCVRAKPSLYPPGAVPGSKSLYDDFIAVHLNQTLFIHLTVSTSIRPPQLD